MNDQGDVLVGYAEAPNAVSRAYIYSDSSGVTELPWPNGLVLGAVGLNNRGQVAAYGGRPGSANYQSYRYTPGEGYLTLGDLGSPPTEAKAINNRGQVTGYSTGMDGQSHAFRFTDGVGLENITPGFGRSYGYAINDLGWVAGAGDELAFLFREDQGVIILGPGRAYGLNNLGAVVGYPGFVYKDAQRKALSGADFGDPALYDINDRGEAVGIGTDGLGRLRALLWTEADGLLDLNTLVPEGSGWQLIAGVAINEAGQVLCHARFEGQSRPVRLDPMPVPVLRISLVSTSVVLSWVPYWRQLVLEASDSLSPSQWHAVPGGETSPVVLPATQASRFFRLNSQPTYTPRLSLRRSGANLVISWTPDEPGWVLESSPSLSPPTWTPVPGGTNSPVTVPLAGAAGFFRLRK